MTPSKTDLQHRWCPANERKLWQFAIGAAVAAIIFMSGPRAMADATGSVCVENGGVISVDGKRSSGHCIEGTMVRLYGVSASSLDHECRVGGDEIWRCGLASAAALLQAVKGRQIECRGNSVDSEGRLIAICFIAGRSLNQFMVEMGWAHADRETTSMFNEIEQEARAARRGLWSSEYSPNTAD